MGERDRNESKEPVAKSLPERSGMACPHRTVEDRPLSVLHPVRGMVWAAGAAGPGAAGIIMAINYRRIGRKRAALMFGVIATVMFCVTVGITAFTITHERFYTASAAYVCQLVLVYIFGKRLQKDLIERHIADGGTVASVWRYVGIAFFFGAIVLGGLCISYDDRRIIVYNNLKDVGLAMHNYADVHGGLPARFSEKEGKPLLSWRVPLLPFLGQSDLYKKFHLDEPWDSAHNKQLITSIPAVYVSPNQILGDGKTVFLVASGIGMLLDEAKSTSFSTVSDGPSNTILAVEADQQSAVIWTKPDDLAFDTKNPKNGLGNMQPDGYFYVLLADGSVKLIPNAVDIDVLRAMFTKAGGEEVLLPF